MGDQILYRFGLLPEQVSKDNGEPCWVIPLTWSHAMYVLVLADLKRRGFYNAKTKSFYVCQECGYESIGWMGKCPSCNQWNTFVEEIQEPKSKSRSGAVSTNVKPVNINDIEADTEERYLTGIKEMDRVLGGGIVKGSLILVGGDPGIGKSTLLLQICDKIKTNAKILYVSGEESIKQIKLRADRLNVRNPNLLMLSETNFKVIQALSETERPILL